MKSWFIKFPKAMLLLARSVMEESLTLENNEENSVGISEVLKGLFSKSDPMFDLKRKNKFVPLKKRDDIAYEVQQQSSDFENEGHKILLISQNQHGETILVTRLYYGDGMDEEDITLRVRVINEKGVIVPDSMAFLIVDHENLHMRIADIRVEGDRVNRGYGSLIMQAIIKIVDELGIKCITGWISSVDWDHIERSEHFYRKFGFDVDLNHETMHGTITWINHKKIDQRRWRNNEVLG
ncbi:GNAT family N-acetyltransferase [Paenibacillus sp. MAH-34]|uniref:GNAT family N-acetyltransferase n=1 Tax=Paenibacillus anseongense TaxID=2682845 RepID=A0ABW9TZT9_9BACL|nr:GNAT family N-acetyltransferase [Paenibacillus anseongense]